MLATIEFLMCSGVVMVGLAPEVWFPVVTLMGGAMIGVITQTITDWRTAERERLARLEQRQDAARDRRIEFQRATLLELRERVGELIRAAGEANHSDEMSLRKQVSGDLRYCRMA